MKESKREFITTVKNLDASFRGTREQIEATRLDIERHARYKVSIYQEEVERIIPEAKHALNKIILPWWKEFISSESYRLIGANMRELSYTKLALCEPINYYWPDNTILELQGSKPFYELATNLMGESVDQHSHPNKFDQWRGKFYLEGQGDKNPLLIFEPWNEARASWAFSIAVKRLQVTVDPKLKDRQLVSKIHPSVLVAFSEHILEGSIWETLNKSVQKAQI